MSILAASFPTHAAEAEVGDGTYDTAEDPFTTSSAQAQRSYQQRYSTFDNHSFSLNHSSSSPAQAKCALEAHILETDRRLQETSRLGTALIQQRKDLNDRLKEVEMQYSQGEIGPELRQKIISLEKEFHEAGRGNTRASIALKPRLRNPDEPSNGSYGQGFNVGYLMQYLIPFSLIFSTRILPVPPNSPVRPRIHPRKSAYRHGSSVICQPAESMTSSLSQKLVLRFWLRLGNYKLRPLSEKRR